MNREIAWAGDDDQLPELGDYPARLDEDLTAAEFHPRNCRRPLRRWASCAPTHSGRTARAADRGLHPTVRAVYRLRADGGDPTRERPVTHQATDGSDAT